VTTGVPLYLVSACASAEDFVAAFRRYADRAGLFVPIADPLPQGRRGRIAVMLKDGRVMLEGEVEIASSSTKPAPVHGRVGMTLRFIEPDEPSKTVLAELEKARLAMKPQPSSIPPRSSHDVPAEPRPVPPAVGGRIDAANALAECVLIGDAGAMKEAPRSEAAGPGKFVIPTIPSMGGPARPKTPSTPPALTRPKSTTAVPPPTPALGVKATPPPTPRRDPTPVPKATTPKATTLGMPVVKPPASAVVVETEKPRDDETSPLLMKSTPSPAPPSRPKTPSTPPSPRSATPFAPLPIVRRPAADATDGEESTDLTGIPEGPPVGELQRKTSLGVAMMSAIPIEPAGADDSGRMHIGPPPKPPGAPPDKPADKPADKPGRSGGLRASEIMAAIAPSDDWTMTPDAVAPTVLAPEDKPPAPPTEQMPAPVIEDSKPNVPGPTGDWTISADPSAADGWSEPAKVVPPEPKPQPASGNRNIAVSSSAPIEAVEWEEKPTGIGEALVQIDPTLMEPLKPMPVFDDERAAAPPAPPFPNATGQNRAIPTPLPFSPPQYSPPVPPPLAPPPLVPPPLSPSVAIPTPPPMPAPPGLFSTTGANQAIPPGMTNVEVLDLTSRPRPDLTDGNTGFFRETGEVPHYPSESTDAINPSRKRTLVIAIGGALAITAVLVVVVFALGGSKKKAKRDTGSSTPIVDIGSGSAIGSGGGSAGSNVAMIQPPDGSNGSNHDVEPPVDAGIAAPQTCAVDVTSSPTGAEVAIDKTNVLGTTPVTIQLPCGVETKLYVRKAKYNGTIKSFTASAENTKVLVKLAPPMIQVKVTSVPPGATITVGGKVVGITPSTIKLPAQGASITLSKDGYVPDTQKIAPKANGAHHVNLKKGVVKQKLR